MPGMYRGMFWRLAVFSSICKNACQYVCWYVPASMVRPVVRTGVHGTSSGAYRRSQYVQRCVPASTVRATVRTSGRTVNAGTYYWNVRTTGRTCERTNIRSSGRRYVPKYVPACVLLDTGTYRFLLSLLFYLTTLPTPACNSV